MVSSVVCRGPRSLAENGTFSCSLVAAGPEQASIGQGKSVVSDSTLSRVSARRGNVGEGAPRGRGGPARLLCLAVYRASAIRHPDCLLRRSRGTFFTGKRRLQIPDSHLLLRQKLLVRY